MTMEHHVILGDGHQAAKLMNTECFPISPKLKQGACFSRNVTQATLQVLVWCNQTNPVSVVMRFNGSRLDFKLSFRTVLFIWVK